MATGLSDALTMRTVSLDRLANAMGGDAKPSDTHMYGTVVAVVSDASYGIKHYRVILNGGSSATTCAPLCDATVDDRVLCVLQTNGRVAAIGRVGGSANRVLWSGKWYMMDTQTATLAGAISQQPNGVVLVWSRYRDSDAEDSNFTFDYIPKHFVSAHEGKGVNCLVALNATMADKYLYINDTKIVGHSRNNNTAYTFMGQTINMKTWVLRYVIGV